MMKPLGNNILVEPFPQEKVTKSGILIPDNATPKNMEWGRVLETFDMESSEGNKLNVGDRVLFYGRKCYEENGQKIVEKFKIVYWDDKGK